MSPRPARSLLPAPVVALVVALAATAAPAPFAPPARAQDGQAAEGMRPLLVPGRGRSDLADEPSALALPDEQKIERARNLVRAGYAGQAGQMIDDVAARHPDDLDVLLARAELLGRTSDGTALVRYIDEAGARPGVRRQLATRPHRAGFWLRYRAEALFASGRPGEGARAVVAAWEASAEQGPWAHVRLEDARTADPSAAAAAYVELRKAADRHPEREDLAVAAAQQEARSGQMKAAIRRVQRAGDAAPDGPRGSALWRFGLSFLERDEGNPALADSVFAALALDGSADADLRRQAVDRLFDDVPTPGARSAGPGGAGFAPVPNSVPTPGVTSTPVTRLTVDAEGHLVVDRSEPPGTLGGVLARRANLPTPASTAASLTALERVWRGLPPSRETVRRGLDLAERMRAVGDVAGAARVEEQAARLARALPPADGGGPGAGRGAADPDLDARLALREGESALAGGDLGRASAAFARVAQSGASERVKEQAEFEMCETAFYAGDFDSAAAAYDRFARAHPAGERTNDALARAYLIESGDGGPVPGLRELARAMRAARAGSGDDALAAATEAEQASANGPAWAEAELLLADLLAARGRTAEAATKAAGVADAKPDDRLAPAARKKAGDLYHTLGQDALALAQYDALLTTYPRSWLAPETRRLANELRARAGTNP